MHQLPNRPSTASRSLDWSQWIGGIQDKPGKYRDGIALLSQMNLSNPGLRSFTTQSGTLLIGE